MKNTGMNTATSESVIDRMVNPISLAPSSAACIGGLPPSMWRTMFSSITIASSTTNPAESVSASSERLSRLWPSGRIAPNVPTIESGSARLAMIVAGRLRRNTKITSTTSASAMTKVVSTSATECRIEIERSLRVSRRTEPGSCGRSRSTRT